jgi:hypothetical protein
VKEEVFPRGVLWLCILARLIFFAKIPEKPPAVPDLLRLQKNPTKICARRKI